jgi:hypothetical protein
MKKVLITLMAIASLTIASTAHAGGFGGSFAGGLAGGIISGVINSAVQASRPQPTSQVIVVHERRTVVVHHYDRPAPVAHNVPDSSAN